MGTEKQRLSGGKQRKRDRTLAQRVQGKVPKDWTEEQREAEGRKWGAAHWATKCSLREAGCWAGGGYLGTGSVPRANLPFITEGLSFVGESSPRNPPQKHTASEIFLGWASWYWPPRSAGDIGKRPELPSPSSGPAARSLKYLTSSRETQMDLAMASPVRSPKNSHTACSAVTFHKRQLQRVPTILPLILTLV